MSDALGFLPDTKPDVAEPWRKVLLDAADYIEAHGWCQNDARLDDGRVCILGAIDATHPYQSDGPAWDRLRNFCHKHYGAGADSPIYFNDAPGRTAAEVTAALRACASQ